MSPQKAIYATGRRKAASARVYLSPVKDSDVSNIVVNGRALAEYFPQGTKQQVVLQPLVLSDRLSNYNFKITVSGGGYAGQAGAVLHGIARALEKAEPELRPGLKKAGFLTRDAREVERKKAGKHKARKSTQFSKR